MNKNALIGLLVAVVVIGGGYLLLRNPSTSTTYVTPPNTDTGTIPPATTPPDTSAPLTLGTPAVVTNPSATVSSSSALVNGQVTPNGVATTYWFEYGLTSTPSSRTDAQQIGSGFNPISAPAFISGLKANTLYYYRLMADNNLGTVYGATYSFTTNTSPAPRASKPTAGTNNASAITRTSATLNGQVNPKGFETNYWFEYGTDSSLGNTSSITSITDAGSLNSNSSVSTALTGLAPLTKYFFRLNAQNQFGTVNGGLSSFTTSGPANAGIPAVTATVATNITNTTARLNGRVNSNGADTTYWFEYSTDSLLGSIIGSGTPTQTVNAGTNTVTVHFDVNSLARNTKYYFHLVGRNQFGTVDSSILSFTTKS